MEQHVPISIKVWVDVTINIKVLVDVTIWVVVRVGLFFGG